MKNHYFKKKNINLKNSSDSVFYSRKDCKKILLSMSSIYEVQIIYCL